MPDDLRWKQLQIQIYVSEESDFTEIVIKQLIVYRLIPKSYQCVASDNRASPDVRCYSVK